MLLKNLEKRRILFFGGKGGVGKTTLASAVGAGFAARGKRVLVVSTDPAHNLGHLWQREVGSQPVRLMAGLDGVELDPAHTVDEHLETVGRSLRRLMPERLGGEVTRHLEAAREAPGMVEAALLERIAVTLEEGLRTHDLVIFDTAPSGHTVRLLELPELMAAWTEGLLDRRRRAERFGAALGQFRASSSTDDATAAKLLEGEPDREHEIRVILTRRQDRLRGFRAALTDPDETAFVIVLTADRLPVLETIELAGKLRSLRVPIGGLVVNKRAPNRADDFWAARAAQEDANLEMLDEQLGTEPRIEIPLSPTEIVGGTALLEFSARHLA